MIPLNDHLARNSKNWYQSSALISPFDIYLCATVDMLLVLADFRAAIGKANMPRKVSEVYFFSGCR
jgi:hypothetical protein